MEIRKTLGVYFKVMSLRISTKVHATTALIAAASMS